jgi:signal transduction histidine kinase
VRPRVTILVKLLLAFVLPTAVLFSAFAVVAYEVTRRDLDDELGARLEAVAAVAATHVRGKYLLGLSTGDESERSFQNVMRKLEAVSAATGTALFVFDRQLDSRADTRGAAIGTHYYRVELDRHELLRVFDRGELAHSVTFEGDDGRTYKAGYAPVRASETEPEIVLAIGAQAPARYFDRLHQLRTSLLWWGGSLLLVVLAASMITTALVTRPVRRLADAAERIGRGELGAPIDVGGRDEIGTLAQTMDRMREQLAERDAHMQRMLAGIAHEVRNPLAGMTLFAGILREELPAGAAGDESRGHVARIERELVYLERVVSEFLEYARRAPAERGELELGELVREVAQLAAAGEVRVEVELPEPGGEGGAEPPMPKLRADAAQLRRALLNIAQNAVQATLRAGRREPVRLIVRWDRREATATLAITNPGANLPEEVRQRMFEPFFTTREKGTGLGLAFAKEIVHEHGGEIRVEVGEDATTFVVVLPAPSAGPRRLATNF